MSFFLLLSIPIGLLTLISLRPYKLIKGNPLSNKIFLFFLITLPILGRYPSIIIFIISLILMVKKIKIIKHGLIISYIGIIFIGILSMINSIDLFSSVRELLILCLYFLISLVFTSSVYEASEDYIKKIIKSIMISITIITLLASLNTLSIVNFQGKIILLNTNNHLAFYLGGILVITVIHMYENLNQRAKLSPILFLLILTIVVAGSRGAWVSILVTIALYAVFLKKYKTVILMLILLIAVSINFELLPEELQRTLLSITNETETFSNAERISIWNSSFEMIKDHPFVGIGLDNWRYYFKLPEYMFAINEYPHAHNFYLQQGAEIGIIGVSFYISVIVQSFKYSLYSFRHTKNTTYKTIAISVGFFVTYTAIYLLFNNPLFNSVPAMLFYSLVGINAGLYLKIKWKGN